jgi:alpha-glucosidase
MARIAGLAFLRRRLSPAPGLLLVPLFVLTGAARAQDQRSVKSPDGRIEFRLFTALPDGAILNSLAYQVWLGGEPVIDTSFLGLDILFQEPELGDNVGLSADRAIHEAHYNGLWADYLQTSTTGRRIQFEVRVWNDGVAFRYIVPRSALLFDLAIADEMTQFHFAGAPGPETSLPERAALPYVREVAGVGWLGIYSQDAPGFPKTELRRLDSRTMMTHLPGGIAEQSPAFQTATPWTGPWRVIVVGPDRARLGESQVFRELLR